MTKAMKSATRRDIYTEVTNKIIAELEQGAAPWVKPWTSGRKNGIGVMPANAATGRTYAGINVPILWMAAADRGFEQPGWMTLNQANKLGGKVRKGEKGTTVVFTKRIVIDDKAAVNPSGTGDDDRKEISMLRAYTVFNLSQIDGLADDLMAPPPPLPSLNWHLEQAGAFITSTGADIRYGGDRACYVPSRDFINLPPVGAFKSIEQFQATALHELSHWSGASHRLDRDLTGRFGSQSYAAEELIAELSAAFLCAHLGIQGELRHAGYIDSWLKLLASDKRAIFTAASQASKAADYLRSFSEHNTGTETPAGSRVLELS